MADNGADVADDYRQALEDLTVNSRIEIATLTNIARENASHGFAISEALSNHIKSVPPHRTLPALYVLDSVVKNVPTPYALYFGPKLYSIFMGAYTKVDNSTRRKMDEMLKTWKEPVPGSISTKPVFPPELVRPIENALMGARNAFAARQNSNFQAQQQLMRGRQPAPSRETPTPPTGRPYQPPPPQQQNQQQPAYPGSNGHRPDTAPAQPQQSYPMTPANGPNAIPLRATPQPAPSAGPYPPYQQQPPAGPVYGAPQPGISIDKLKDDVQRLIIAEKAEFAQDPLDTSKQTRLKALLDLQTIIQSQDMPQDQLMIINDRVAELAVNIRPQQQQQQQQQQHHHLHQQPQVSAGPAGPGVAAPYLGGASPYTTPTPPVVSQQPTPVPSAAAVVAAALARPQSATAAAAAPRPPPAGGGVSIDALLGQGALAALISGAARKSATPPVPPPGPAVPPSIPPSAAAVIAAALRSPRLNEPPRLVAAPPPPAAAAPPAGDPSALLTMLRQSGLIKPGLTPTPPPPGAGFGGFQSLGGAVAPGNGQLSVASLKSFRAHLIPRLYDDLGPPCSQCGRRFQTTDEGRRKKTAHMDWHFRVHQRMADAERRGQHRSWYVDELDWIRTREAIDTDYTDPSTSSTQPSSGSAVPGGGGPSTSSSAAAANRVPYIPVPEDSSRVSSACPICQEKFEMKWLDEAQEWVWTDAVRVGGRVFHASCYGEAYGGVPGAGAGWGGGVLGKRKAEDDAGGVRGRVKMEGW
ncbi:protein PCF11 [Staphylotrichum tortipilum]|uniref:Protein PCF11 n=1 Tax=Staphylotrichum tortipilum TaxID=2831512 RepID=A0AAN6RQ94_9PEZI|nr:protein PCF11 [Staphylotrichum longicolle]